MKRLLFFLLLSLPAFGQGVIFGPQTAFKTVNGITSPIAGATITVCAANASGIPCSPVLTNTIFSNVGLTQPLSNPFTSDSNGNYSFAAAANTYTVTVTAAGFSGYSYQTTGTSGGGGSGTVGPGTQFCYSIFSNAPGTQIGNGTLCENLGTVVTLEPISAQTVTVNGPALITSLNPPPGALTAPGGSVFELGEDPQGNTAQCFGSTCQILVNPELNAYNNGVVGNGSTNDSTALQNAITSACGSNTGASLGSRLTFLPAKTINFSSTENFNLCGGLDFGPMSGGTGQAGTSTIFNWTTSGGTVFCLNRTRDSLIENVVVNASSTSTEPNIVFDLDEAGCGTGSTGILSHNLFRGISIQMPGSMQNSSFRGFRIGNSAPGNTEQQAFEHVNVNCGGGTVSDTSNGIGFAINTGAGTAQPFYIPIHESEINGCSHAIEINYNTRDVIADGGNFGGNFHDLYLRSGDNTMLENFVTTGTLSSSVYLNGYAGQWTVFNNSFTGPGAAVVDVTNASGGAKGLILSNNFGAGAMLNGTFMTGGSGFLNIIGNTNFTGCPTQSSISQGMILYNTTSTPSYCDNMFISTGGTFWFASRNDQLQNSPAIKIGGGYQNSGTPTFATDYWGLQNVIGSGTNGTSTLTLTHSGTSGTLTFDATAAALFKTTAQLNASYFDVTEIAAPANPASGNERWYANSSTHVLSCLTSSGGNCAPSGGGSPSITFGGVCNGTAASNTTIVPLVGLGGSPVSGLCNSSGGTGQGLPSSLTCTMHNLYVLSVGNGVNGSDGVFTLLDNGSTTALTCTTGTANNCHDTTHTVSVTAGDRIALQIATQTGSTLSNMTAQMYCQ